MKAAAKPKVIPSYVRPIKRLEIKVFLPGNKQHRTHHVKCPPGTKLKTGGEEFILGKFAAELEVNFPNDEYSLKEVGRGKFNFVWIGKRAIAEDELLVGGMRLGEVASLADIEGKV